MTARSLLEGILMTRQMDLCSSSDGVDDNRDIVIRSAESAARLSLVDLLVMLVSDSWARVPAV